MAINFDESEIQLLHCRDYIIVLIHVHIPFFLSRSPKLLWQDGSEHTTGQGTDHGR